MTSYGPTLDRIDWNFPQAGTAVGSIHKAHWFPGNFIPQIPAALIEVLSIPGDLVLDPFGGSGTTNLEAARLGRRTIYSDAVSACVFVAQGKLATATRGLTPATLSKILLSLTWDHACVTDDVGAQREGSDPALIRWYDPRTLAELRYIWKIIELHDGTERQVLELAFSDLLFACGSTGGSLTSSGKVRRHHWGWIADNVIPKNPVYHDAIDGFRSRIQSLRQHFEPLYEPIILQSEAQHLPLDSASIDLIVTSPPYIGVIDYVKANRLLYLWMNWPFDNERAHEIGARYKRKRPSLPDQYLSDMAKCWKELHRVLRPGGKLAIVIGESRAFPGVFELSMADLATHMPITWGPRERLLTRRRVSDRAASDAREIVLVAEKI